MLYLKKKHAVELRGKNCNLEVVTLNVGQLK